MPLRSIILNFLQHVDQLENPPVDDDPYDREFQNLKLITDEFRTSPQYSCSAGELDLNRRKNRYKDILPYDSNRVVLTEILDVPGSDYINASFIKGASGSKAYIAAQAPLSQTVNDFWRMIWECEVPVIIMACNEIEGGRRKCEKYWPDPGERLEFGAITVALIERKDLCSDFTARKFSVSKGNVTKAVHQCHYHTWPDHGIPMSVTSLLEMVKLARGFLISEILPILVHCSAGCGRTGTICAVDYVGGLLRSGKLSEDFSLQKLIIEMRAQRIAMVQTKDQYVLVHKAVRDLFCDHLKIIDTHPYENIDFKGIPVKSEKCNDYKNVITANVVRAKGKAEEIAKTNSELRCREEACRPEKQHARHGSCTEAKSTTAPHKMLPEPDVPPPLPAKLKIDSVVRESSCSDKVSLPSVEGSPRPQPLNPPQPPWPDRPRMDYVNRWCEGISKAQHENYDDAASLSSKSLQADSATSVRSNSPSTRDDADGGEKPKKSNLVRKPSIAKLKSLFESEQVTDSSDPPSLNSSISDISSKLLQHRGNDASQIAKRLNTIRNGTLNAAEFDDVIRRYQDASFRIFKEFTFGNCEELEGLPSRTSASPSSGSADLNRTQESSGGSSNEEVPRIRFSRSPSPGITKNTNALWEVRSDELAVPSLRSKRNSYAEKRNSIWYDDKFSLDEAAAPSVSPNRITMFFANGTDKKEKQPDSKKAGVAVKRSISMKVGFRSPLIRRKPFQEKKVAAYLAIEEDDKRQPRNNDRKRIPPSIEDTGQKSRSSDGDQRPRGSGSDQKSQGSDSDRRPQGSDGGVQRPQRSDGGIQRPQGSDGGGQKKRTVWIEDLAVSPALNKLRRDRPDKRSHGCNNVKPVQNPLFCPSSGSPVELTKFVVHDEYRDGQLPSRNMPAGTKTRDEGMRRELDASVLHPPQTKNQEWAGPGSLSSLKSQQRVREKDPTCSDTNEKVKLRSERRFNDCQDLKMVPVGVEQVFDHHYPENASLVSSPAIVVRRTNKVGNKESAAKTGEVHVYRAVKRRSSLGPNEESSRRQGPSEGEHQNVATGHTIVDRVCRPKNTMDGNSFGAEMDEYCQRIILDCQEYLVNHQGSSGHQGGNNGTPKVHNSSWTDDVRDPSNQSSSNEVPGSLENVSDSPSSDSSGGLRSLHDSPRFERLWLSHTGPIVSHSKMDREEPESSEVVAAASQQSATDIGSSPSVISCVSTEDAADQRGNESLHLDVVMAHRAGKMDLPASRSPRDAKFNTTVTELKDIINKLEVSIPAKAHKPKPAPRTILSIKKWEAAESIKGRPAELVSDLDEGRNREVCGIPVDYQNYREQLPKRLATSSPAHHCRSKMENVLFVQPSRHIGEDRQDHVYEEIAFCDATAVCRDDAHQRDGIYETLREDTGYPSSAVLKVEGPFTKPEVYNNANEFRFRTEPSDHLVSASSLYGQVLKPVRKKHLTRTAVGSNCPGGKAVVRHLDRDQDDVPDLRPCCETRSGPVAPPRLRCNLSPSEKSFQDPNIRSSAMDSGVSMAQLDKEHPDDIENMNNIMMKAKGSDGGGDDVGVTGESDTDTPPVPIKTEDAYRLPNDGSSLSSVQRSNSTSIMDFPHRLGKKPKGGRDPPAQWKIIT